MTRLSADSNAVLLARLAMLLAAALILSWLEAMLPPLAPIPGVKPGLANIAVMLAVMLISRKAGFAVMLARVAVISLLFGSVTSFWFSLAGGALALAVSASIKSTYLRGGRITLVGASVLSSAAHNIGQIFAACILFNSPAPLGMLAWLLFASIPTGLLTGFLCELCYRRLN